ncbi:MAG TPA: hypothetical protein VH479_01395 [Acidimicrobiales bacterium]
MGDARRTVTGVVLAVAVTAYGWWAVGLPAFSALATVAVVGAGAGAMVVGARARRRPGAAQAAGRTWPWFVLAGLLACVQLIAYVQQPRDEHPTLSSLTNAALDTHAARAVAFLAWLAAAVELARR